MVRSYSSVVPESDAAPAAPRGCTDFKLRQLSRRVSRHYDAAVSSTGLKNTQYSLLTHVVLLGPIQLSTLAEKMQLDPSTLTRNLRPMVEQGWVSIEPGEDARSRHVVVTEAGNALRAETKHAWKRAQLSINGALGDQRVAHLHALIDECMAVLDAADRGDADE